MRRLAFLLFVSSLVHWNSVSAETFDTPNSEIDALVEECVDDLGVRLIGDDENVACFNEAIFPGSFFSFNSLPVTRLTIITSPGGHVLTARLMAAALDQRGGRVVIADQCASACAMMLAPAVEDLHIHRSAHFAVHGITTLEHEEFGRWEQKRTERRSRGVRDSFLGGLSRGLGFSSGYYAGGRDQFEAHLEGQGIDLNYQLEIGERMM